MGEDNITVTISEEEYDRLLESEDWLRCLEAAGVDNWGGFEIAQEISNGD